MSNKLSKLKYSNGDCGSGKTRETIKLFNNDNVKSILVQNTIKLMEQSQGYLNDSVLICSSNDSDESVMNRVVEFLQNPTHKVLIISDKTFSGLAVSLLHGWRIVVDDATTFSSFKNINESDVDMKKIVQNKIFSELKVFGDDAKYITAQKNNNDGELLGLLTRSFNIIENNDKFFMNSDWFIEADKVQLGITAFRDMKKYVGLDITFIANNFENSTVYLAHPEIFEKVEIQGLETREVPFTERLSVFYFSETNLSKTWKDDNPQELKKVYDYLNKTLNSDYYWTNNNSDTLSLNGTKISPDARGINSLQHFNTCVWLACMRPNPVEVVHNRYAFGIDGDQLVAAREHENIYQFVNRGVVRDYRSSEVQVVYVFSKEQAHSLGVAGEFIDLGLDITVKKSSGGQFRDVVVPASVKVSVSRFKKDKSPSVQEFREWVMKKKWSDEVKALVIKNFMRKC